MNTLTIQKVNGLIKRSPVTFTSHKLPASSRNVRTPGLYARTAYDGRIVIGFDTWAGSRSYAEIRPTELAKFSDFAIAEGYTLKPYERDEFVIEVSE